MVDELNSGGLKRCNHRIQCPTVGLGQPALKIHDRLFGHAAVPLEIRLCPVEQASSGAGLSRAHAISVLKMLTF